MKKGKIHVEKKLIFINVLILVLLVCGFAGLNWHVNDTNEQSISYDLKDHEKDVDLTITRPKEWSEKSHGYVYGAQYDVAIKNKTGHVLKDWNLDLNIEGNFHLDSSWSGEFVKTETGLSVSPVDYNEEIEPHEEIVIGFVAYTDEIEMIKNADLHFHRVANISAMIAFWFLCLLTVVWVAVNIVRLYYSTKTKYLMERNEEYQKIVNASFLTFANMIDAKDPYTKGHSQRVAIYSKEIAKRMGMDEDEQQHVFYVALIHDIGKIGVPDAILKKTGKLDSDEREIIKEHVMVGGDILRDFFAIEDLEAGARYHHERYDGDGYAYGLSGEDIPLVARIIGVADAFDAMTSMRCYRKKLPMDQVIDELKTCSGSQFDPKIVPYLLRMIEEGVAPVKSDSEDLEKLLQGA